MFSNRVILPLFNSLKKDSLKIVRLSEPNLGFIRRTFTKRKINQLGDVADPNILNTGFSRARQIPFVIKSSLFTFGFGAGCYSGAVIVNYERNRIKANKNGGFNNKKSSDIRNQINEIWNSLSNVQKAVIGIIFLNSLVCIGWRLPNVQPTLAKYFLLLPTSGRYSQMALATFSHIQPFHILFNMFALYSMSSLLARIFPVEQFLAFYLSAGVFASLSSNLFKITTSNMAPSIGASGAIIACFALVSLVNPKSEFYVFPIPYAIEAQNLLKFLVAFDIICLLLGSKRLDHAAHLGGSLYGYLFFKYGPTHLNQFQSNVINEWKKIRPINK